MYLNFSGIIASVDFSHIEFVLNILIYGKVSVINLFHRTPKMVIIAPHVLQVHLRNWKISCDGL